MAKKILHDVLRKHGLFQQEGQLITDGGSENCGAVAELLARPGILWKKLVAQVDITQSNSMVEAMNKIISVASNGLSTEAPGKERFLFP